jgi:hypothetical protein
MRAASRLRFALVLAALPVAGAARAEGSLGLDEVLDAVKGAPQLVSEIDVELRKRDIKANQVICIGARHGNQWKHLGGGRAAPYACEIGDRRLTVEADRTYFDINGKRLGQLGQAPDKVLFARAKSFRETNLRWTWKP